MARCAHNWLGKLRCLDCDQTFEHEEINKLLAKVRALEAVVEYCVHKPGCCMIPDDGSYNQDACSCGLYTAKQKVSSCDRNG